MGQRISTLTQQSARPGPFRIIYENHGTMEEYREKLQRQAAEERQDMVFQMLLMILQNQMES